MSSKISKTLSQNPGKIFVCYLSIDWSIYHLDIDIFFRDWYWYEFERGRCLTKGTLVNQDSTGRDWKTLKVLERWPSPEVQNTFCSCWGPELVPGPTSGGSQPYNWIWRPFLPSMDNHTHNVCTAHTDIHIRNKRSLKKDLVSEKKKSKPKRRKKTIYQGKREYNIRKLEPSHRWIFGVVTIEIGTSFQAPNTLRMACVTCLPTTSWQSCYSIGA